MRHTGRRGQRIDPKGWEWRKAAKNSPRSGRRGESGPCPINNAKAAAGAGAISLFQVSPLNLSENQGALRGNITRTKG